MRKIIGFVIICIAVNSSCMTDNLRDALAYGAMAKVIFKVMDTDGIPVSNAYVRAGFWLRGKKNNAVESYTDDDGCLIAKKKCNDDVNYWIEKDGYYVSQGQKKMYDKTVAIPVKDGKWQPYGAEIPVILKKIKNPVPMYACNAATDFKFPVSNQKIGFDLEIMDWVKPYGSGILDDFLITFHEDRAGGYWNYKYTLTINFSNQFSGAYIMKKESGSNFVSSYHASTNQVYQNTFTYVYDRLTGSMKTDIRLQDDEYLVFRTRTKTDIAGNLISAHYGKLYGPIKFWRSLVFSGIYFNPTPNDTNIEFDPSKNLYHESKGLVLP